MRRRQQPKSAKVKISFTEIKQYFGVSTYNFHKYTTQLINLANQNSQATRPKMVDQLSELIKEFPGKELKEWEQWYRKQYPKAINRATEKILTMLQKLEGSLEQINKKMIANWVKDLVIIKTFIGFKFQKAILKKGAELLGDSHRLAKPPEEAKGIDGFIGALPVSIKPDSYKVKSNLREKIEARLIYYRKVKDGIEVDYSEIFRSEQ